MLDRIASLFEADEESEEGRAFVIGCVSMGRAACGCCGILTTNRKYVRTGTR